MGEPGELWIPPFTLTSCWEKGGKKKKNHKIVQCDFGQPACQTISIPILSDLGTKKSLLSTHPTPGKEKHYVVVGHKTLDECKKYLDNYLSSKNKIKPTQHVIFFIGFTPCQIKAITLGGVTTLKNLFNNFHQDIPVHVEVQVYGREVPLKNALWHNKKESIRRKIIKDKSSYSTSLPMKFTRSFLNKIPELSFP